MGQRKRLHGAIIRANEVQSARAKPATPDSAFDSVSVDTPPLTALPDHETTRALRQDAMLQMQRQQGNSAVQRFIANLGLPGKLVQREGDPSVVAPPDEGNPLAPADPGTIEHPWARTGSTGPAVEELQQKLNAAGADPALDPDGIFGPLTRQAVINFQRDNGLGVDGIVGPETWGAIDAMGLGSDVGRVERSWHENVGGQTYGMTSKYTWRINDSAKTVTVTVKLKFTGIDPPGLVDGWLAAIQAMWNRFNIVNADGSDSYELIFDPQRVNSRPDNEVEIMAGNGRSNAGQWYSEDPDSNDTACHEFGHMVGLEDEYQRAHADYTRLTGEEPDSGATTGDADPADIARELHDALGVAVEADRVTAAKGVITSHGLVQGDFAQQVAAAYQTAFGAEIVQDIDDHIPDDDEWDIVDPFTHSSQSIMGMGGNHDHPLEPRHVREFAHKVQDLKGGVWRPVER